MTFRPELKEIIPNNENLRYVYYNKIIIINGASTFRICNGNTNMNSHKYEMKVAENTKTLEVRPKTTEIVFLVQLATF